MFFSFVLHEPAMHCCPDGAQVRAITVVWSPAAYDVSVLHAETRDAHNHKESTITKTVRHPAHPKPYTPHTRCDLNPSHFPLLFNSIIHQRPKKTTPFMHRLKNKIKVNKNKNSPLDRRASASPFFCYISPRNEGKRSKPKKSWCLYSLDLVGHHHRILLADFGRGFSFVVVWAVVLVWITVKPTEEVSTATVEPWAQQYG